MICIRFSNRIEAELVYKLIVTEEKLWLLKEYEKEFEVQLSVNAESLPSTFEIRNALLSSIRIRKLPGWIEGVLRHRYYYEDQHEIQRVLEIAHEFEAKPPAGLNLPSLHKELEKVVKYTLGSSTFIDYDDFCVACLEKIHPVLIEYTGYLIDDYKQEEAYQMLVDSWRSRIHYRDTGVSILHLLDHGGLEYYHDEGNKIRKSETMVYMNQYPDTSIENLQLQWSVTPALVHAPDQLIIYSDNPNHPQLQLLVNIFEEKAIWKSSEEFPFKLS
ncbi:putative sporulation protein YtxC [Halobacillus yeomjeoni]|uniref:putative sporulation protein YtxC n=1 Tax=Halobacillus yeomjeoni TaxID=311194 RepID=UPI001CD2D4B6|nr:putative sporulation protein YtxC [Halobacillus yeomjeoni]MCA0982520.1 putative sporulation protein YtxC [Halobacillus yeomjeoni]